MRDVPVTVKAPVELRPLASADVGSKVLGYLDAVLVDRGDVVKKGQLLALVRPSDLPDQLAAEKGELMQIRANLLLARHNDERAKALVEQGLVSEQEAQQTAAALASNEAQEAASRARIGVLAQRLGETKIEAPIDGQISMRWLDSGALVGPGGAGPIVTVVQSSALRVLISVNEREAGRVRVGQRATVELDGLPGRVFSGQVTRLSPSLHPATRTIDAEVQLANPDGALKPGMYGRAGIVLELHPGAAVVPVEAVIFNEFGSALFVVEGDVARRREVKVGVDGGDWLEIVEGLAPGESVIVAGADGLSDGARVRIAQTQSAPPAVGADSRAR